MQIVIDVDDEILKYFATHDCMDGFPYSSKLLDAFHNCIPIPKGHGAIIDIKQIHRVEIEDSCTGRKMIWNNNPKINDTTYYLTAPTIIEADSEKKGEN